MSMEEKNLSLALPRLVEQVSQRRQNRSQALTMFDLRVGIRDIRLSQTDSAQTGGGTRIQSPIRARNQFSVRISPAVWRLWGALPTI